MGIKPSTRPVSIEQVRSLLKKSARDMKDAITPGLSSERVLVRTTRNANMYTGAEDVSEQDLKTVYQWATRVQAETVGWFQKNMPQALPKR